MCLFKITAKETEGSQDHLLLEPQESQLNFKPTPAQYSYLWMKTNSTDPTIGKTDGACGQISFG
jgi:hypothetical protein